MERVNSVFILGAGASAEAGAPMMNNFIDVALQLLYTDRIEKKDKPAFEDVIKTRDKLQAVHSKSNIDLNNIESVFSAIEMGMLIEKFPNTSSQELRNLLESIKIFIARTIERSIEFPIENQVILPPDSYQNFGSAIGELTKQKKPRHSVSIITFNYDILCDYSLHCNSLQYDYFLDDHQNESVIPLLKLHGSLNWASFPQNQGEKIVPWQVNEYIHSRDWSVLPLLKKTHQKTIYFTVSEQLGDFKLENIHEPNPIPAIIPPTWSKTKLSKELQNVWKKAAQVLGDADNIFILGYSLPESDIYFKYLFSLGTVGEKPLQRIWIFNPYPDQEYKDRYNRLIGSGALQKREFKERKFSEAMNDIAREF